MANTPEVELAISTGRTNNVDGPLYYITVEVTAASNIVPEIFVMSLRDLSNNSYAYSRVASLLDIQNLGTSSVTTASAYRVKAFTVETNSLTYLKELREGIQVIVQTLVDEVSAEEDLGNIENVTTVTIRGGEQ